MTTAGKRQINLRVPIKLGDKIAEAARFEQVSQNKFIENAIIRELDRLRDYDDVDRHFSIITEHEGHVEETPVDPMLMRMFADDRNFSILEWVTDEPGKAEQTMNVGARVRAGTVRIIDTIVNNPNCPYSTRSDFLRDAILTTAYVATRGRLHDERAARFAAQERQFVKTVAIVERNRAQRLVIEEIMASIDQMRSIGGDEVMQEHAAWVYETGARLVRDGGILTYPKWLNGVLNASRTHLKREDRERLDAEFPEALEAVKGANNGTNGQTDTTASQ